jgi:hypothetical protein
MVYSDSPEENQKKTRAQLHPKCNSLPLYLPGRIRRMSTRYCQEGSLERVSRAKGANVWMYRCRDGNRIQRKKVLGNVERLKTKAEAKRKVENFSAQINSELQKIGRMTLGEAWCHFPAA